MSDRSNINITGSAITGENIGSGAGIFAGKTCGTNLQFKSIVGMGNLSIITGSTTITISAGTGGGGITGATNGLTKVGSTVCLGGTATGWCMTLSPNAYQKVCYDNATPTASSFDTYLGDVANSCASELYVRPGDVYQYSHSSIGTAYSDVCPNFIELSTQTGSSCTSLCMNDGKILIISSSAGFGGIKYGADYSANYTNRSLVDKEYVDTHSSGGGITGATNGLGVSGKNICLGGALIKNTAITGAFTLNLTGGTKISTTYGYQISGFTVLCVPTNQFTGNFAAGYSAFASITGGSGNSGFGAYANNALISGSFNTAIGSCALRCGSRGCNNTAVGAGAGCKSNCGNSNTLVGTFAARQSCGSENTAVGLSSLLALITGSGNTAIGTCALYQALGSGNVAIGRCAGFAETGSNKLYVANTGDKSLIYGEFDTEKLCVRGKTYISGLTNATKSNVIYYDSSTKELTYATAPSGSGGTAFGWSCLTNDSTVVGCGSLAYSATYYENTFLGTRVGNNIVNGNGNTAIGTCAFYCNISGSTNTAVGAYSLLVSNGNGNVGIGLGALLNNTIGCYNVSVGCGSLLSNTTGCNNVAIGECALGYNCDWSGSSNVAIGRSAGFAETGSNKLYIANCSTKSLIYGEFDNEKLCIRGKLYVSGLTNATKSNVIYYDSSTKELTYATAPSGSGGTSGIGWSNLVGGSTVAGCGTLVSGSTVNHATYYGVSAGANTTTNGGGNVGIGYLALNKNTNGCFNTAIGYSALNCNTTGNFNIAIGNCTLFANTTGSTNIAIGSSTLSSNTTGTGNIGVGSNSLTSNTTGNQNFAFGNAILTTNNNGCNNIGIGNTVLASNTSGCYNIGIGVQTLHLNTTGNNNVTLGAQALFYNTTGCNNLAIGCQGLLCNVSGSNNVAIGIQALSLNTGGTNNIAMGCLSLRNNTNGTDNIAKGLCSLYANTTGTYNFASGYKTLVKNTVGFSNIAVGYQALCDNVGGTDNTGFGWLALQKNTSGCFNFGAGNNVLANNTTGCYNIGIGATAGAGSTTGSNNISIGCISFCNNATGTDNIAIGSGALFNITGGSNNVAIGRCAGNFLTGSVSNTLVIANCVSTFLIKGDFDGQTICNGGNTTAWQQSSDARIKENVCTISNAVCILTSLNPVIYDYTTGYSTGKNWNECKRVCNYGFVAQEFEQIFPKYTTQSLEIINGETLTDFRSIDTGHLVPILVKAIIEQQVQINDLCQKLNNIK